MLRTCASFGAPRGKGKPKVAHKQAERRSDHEKSGSKRGDRARLRRDRGSAAGRAAPVATGDTCVATGNGTAYTLNITIPSTAPQQFGFAFAARGAAVRNAVVPGSQGRSLPSYYRPARLGRGSRRPRFSQDRQPRA